MSSWGLIDEAKGIQSEIDTTFRAAYEALQKANIELGINLCAGDRRIGARGRPCEDQGQKYHGNGDSPWCSMR